LGYGGEGGILKGKSDVVAAEGSWSERARAVGALIEREEGGVVGVSCGTQHPMRKSEEGTEFHRKDIVHWEGKEKPATSSKRKKKK